MTFTDATASTRSPTSLALASFANAALPLSHARMMRFNADQFNSHLFIDAGIACPESVARSVTRRQAEFFFGRACAREALREMGVLDDGSVPIGEHRAPVWPIGVVGSISHTALIAAAIVAPASTYSGIGMDIETVPSPALLASLASTVVSSAELAFLQSQSDQSPLDLLLTAVFSAKEAFFKATFAEVGRYFEFDAVSVEAIDMRAGSIVLRQNDHLAATLLPGTRHHVAMHMVEPNTVCTLFARHKSE